MKQYSMDIFGPSPQQIRECSELAENFSSRDPNFNFCYKQQRYFFGTSNVNQSTYT